MTNYSSNPGHVQGLLFNRRSESEGVSGKWKYEIVLDMSDYWDVGPTVIDAVEQAWRDGKQTGVVKGATGYWLVVADPYHRHAHPVMVAI